MLTEHRETMLTWEQDKFLLHARLARASKCFKSDTKKLWISLSEGILVAEGAKVSIRRAVAQGLLQLEGVKLTSGRAPAGYAERQLGDFLAKLSAQ